MTNYNWNEGAYYGKKTKTYFKWLDTIIMRLFKDAADETRPVDKDALETLVKLTGRQNTLAHTITKLVETLDTNQRLLDIEKLLNSVPPEAIARARVDVDGLAPRTT